MMSDHVECALVRLAELRGLDGLSLDADRSATIGLEGGIPVLLTLLPDPADAIVLYSELGVPADPLRVYRRALEANHLWQGGQEFILGLTEDTHELTLGMMIAVDENLAEGLADALAAFEQRATEWTQEVDGRERLGPHDDGGIRV